MIVLEGILLNKTIGNSQVLYAGSNYHSHDDKNIGLWSVGVSSVVFKNFKYNPIQ